MRYLITGTAGFIGSHLAARLLQQGHDVLGIDGMTDYYDVALKKARHARLATFKGFKPYRILLSDLASIATEIDAFGPEVVLHMAAQPGVRYSIENPRTYIDGNIGGSFDLLEACRRLRPRHLLIASTSAVYASSADIALAEGAQTDWPLSVYAASKKSMEILAHSYSHLWDIPTTVLRFFTAYGPWGRPDMALSRFVQSILAGRPIDIYNHGKLQRDFTYIDDVVEGTLRLCEQVPLRQGREISPADTRSQTAPFRIVNVGGGQPTDLLEFIDEIERALGMRAKRNFLGLQPGEVLRTEASTQLLEKLTGFRPATPIAVGIERFVQWYREYYKA